MNGATDKLEYSPLPRQCQEEPVPSPDSDTDTEFHDFDEEWEQYLAIIIRQEESGVCFKKLTQDIFFHKLKFF